MLNDSENGFVHLVLYSDPSYKDLVFPWLVHPGVGLLELWLRIIGLGLLGLGLLELGLVALAIGLLELDVLRGLMSERERDKNSFSQYFWRLFAVVLASPSDFARTLTLTAEKENKNSFLKKMCFI